MSLRKIIRKQETVDDHYPFNLDIIRNFESLSLESPVTIIAGDNGSGKTTLLEGIAAAAGSILISGEHMERDHSLSPAFDLADDLKLVWDVKTKNGSFSGLPILLRIRGALRSYAKKPERKRRKSNGAILTA